MGYPARRWQYLQVPSETLWLTIASPQIALQLQGVGGVVSFPLTASPRIASHRAIIGAPEAGPLRRPPGPRHRIVLRVCPRSFGYPRARHLLGTMHGVVNGFRLCCILHTRTYNCMLCMLYASGGLSPLSDVPLCRLPLPSALAKARARAPFLSLAFPADAPA